MRLEVLDCLSPVPQVDFIPERIELGKRNMKVPKLLLLCLEVLNGVDVSACFIFEHVPILGEALDFLC